MTKLFSKLKRDKLFFGLVISAVICALFDVAILIFDIIQFEITKDNSAKLSAAFFGLNITAIVLSFLCVVYAICYLILKKRKIYAIIPKN